MRIARLANRILLAVLLLGVIVLNCGNVCFAAPTGSLTVECVFKMTSGTVYLSGDEYAIALIADAQVDEHGAVTSFETLPPYKDYDCDWSAQTASVLAQKAEGLQKLVEKNKAVLATRKTDAKGVVKFTGLVPGLYLVYRSKAASANKDYTVRPFLVAIPQTYEEGVVYDVKVAPKFSGPSDPATPTDPTDPNLPQTGQLQWPIPVLAVLGVGLFILGLILNRRDKKKEPPK